MKPYYFCQKAVLLSLVLSLINLSYSCNRQRADLKDEQIRIGLSDTLTAGNSQIPAEPGLDSTGGITAYPNSVILTGLAEHRIVTIYRIKAGHNAQERLKFFRGSSDYYTSDGDESGYYMPGIDILYGFNLVNLAHYNMRTEKMNLLFQKPVLVKTFYYPSFVLDSIDKKPIVRNYFLVSVYDEDTNKDTLINRKDLRRIYSFDADCQSKIRLVPENYSVVRSQYDSQNDVMFLFARKDVNRNGTIDEEEPMNIFWINLKSPNSAKLIY
jgi:hypothetical protein